MHPRRAGGHIAQMYRTDPPRQKLCGDSQFATCAWIRRAGSRHHNRIAGPPADLTQPVAHHRREARIGAQRRRHRHVGMPTFGDPGGQVGVHVITRRQERRHDERRSGRLSEHRCGFGSDDVDESCLHRPDSAGHRRAQVMDHLHPGDAAGAVCDQDQHSAGSIANR